MVKKLVWLGELDHGLGRGRREAGQHRLDAAHRAGAGGVELLERPTSSTRHRCWGERQAAEGADELGAQALLQQDHQILRLAAVAGLVEGLAGQGVGAEFVGFGTLSWRTRSRMR